MTDPTPAEVTQLVWLDINQAAVYTGRPVKHLRAAVADRRIRHLRSGRGGKLSFQREWLDDYMLSLEVDAPAATA